MMIIRYRIEAF